MESGETSPPDGRLPDADKGARVHTIQHLRDIFYRMGFTDQEIVALSGAHAMGRCHTDASGYWGPWTFAENSFSNEYFRLLIEERWSPKVSHNGKPWTGPDQYEDSTGQLMMLPSDIALVADPEFKKWVRKSIDSELFVSPYVTCVSLTFSIIHRWKSTLKTKPDFSKTSQKLFRSSSSLVFPLPPLSRGTRSGNGSNYHLFYFMKQQPVLSFSVDQGEDSQWVSFCVEDVLVQNVYFSVWILE